MKSIIKYIFILLLFSTSLYAQTDYYWYQGKKKELTRIKDKEFILIDAKNEVAFQNSIKAMQQDVEPLQNINISSTIQKRNKSANLNNYRWTVSSSATRLQRLAPNVDIVYSAPYYLNDQGKEIGLSHIFYVKLKSDNDYNILEKLADENNVSIIGNNSYMPLWYLLMCTKESTGNALKVANLFHESGKFEYAEPDLMQDDQIECVNDSYFSQQWGLKNNNYSGIDINYCNARNVTQGNSGIIIAVIDYGIQLDHPDINVYSKSFDVETGTSPSKLYGDHGTNCAGIPSARTDNSRGIAGVSPNCPAMSISSTLNSSPTSAAKKADGFNFARTNGASIISCSWNAPELQIVNDAIKLAITSGRNGKGCIIVKSAGNTGGYGTTYPSEVHPDILVVGSIDSNGSKSSFSSYGPALDVMAPGGSIRVATTGSGYTTGSGTSFAGPHVAGIAALILSVNPNLTQKEVSNIIESTSKKIGSGYTNTSGRPNGTWNQQLGYGLVDAYAAVLKAKGGLGTCTTTNFENRTVTSNESVTCNNINVKNVTINANAKLTLTAPGTITFNYPFTINGGGLIEVKNK